MSEPSSISRGAGLLLLAGILLAGASWFASLRWRSVAPPPDAEFAALAAEAEALRENTDAARDSWREQREGLAIHAWTQASLDAFAFEAGENWHWEWSTRDRVRLQRINPQADEWQAYVAFIESLDHRPGMTVEAIEVSATGAGRERGFGRVTIGLRFILAEATMGDGARAGPSPGPPPVAAAGVPDLTRKVGAGRALRPASASSRPDPPGPWAGVQPTIPTNHKTP